MATQKKGTTAKLIMAILVPALKRFLEGDEDEQGIDIDALLRENGYWGMNQLLDPIEKTLQDLAGCLPYLSDNQRSALKQDLKNVLGEFRKTGTDPQVNAARIQNLIKSVHFPFELKAIPLDAKGLVDEDSMVMYSKQLLSDVFGIEYLSPQQEMKLRRFIREQIKDIKHTQKEDSTKNKV